MFKFGAIFNASLLLINAVAILNEERFLARIGWVSSTAQRQAMANGGYNQAYDPSGYGYGNQQGEVSVKEKIIELITAVRTLLRIPLIAVNTIVIIWSLVW